MQVKIERLAQLTVKERLHSLTPAEQREQAALRRDPAIQQWVAELATKSRTLRKDN